MTSTHPIKTLLTSLTLMLPVTITLSACQSTALNTDTYNSVVTTEQVNNPYQIPDLDFTVTPIPDTGISVKADASYPIISLMPFIVRHEKELQLTESQVEAFSVYRQELMQKRITLQNNEKAVRGLLRQALIEGADDSVTTPMMQKINDIEMTHMKLRRNCIQYMRNVLNDTQYNKLIDLYVQSLENE